MSEINTGDGGNISTAQAKAQEVAITQEQFDEFYKDRYKASGDRAFSDKEIGEVLEKHSAKQEKEETQPINPSHYHSQSFDTAVVMEELFLQTAKIAFPDMNKNQVKILLKGFWTGFAQKYLIRLGQKDDIDIELKKAQNYLHRAETGKWMR